MDRTILASDVQRVLGLVVVLAFAFALAVTAGASAPRAGTFVPGQSLGGVGLGMTQTEVKGVWGTKFGRCRECARPTWYFNYRPFEPHGVAAVFERGRAVHLFTVWRPEGWRTREGLALGANEAEITKRYGTLGRRRCVGYDALVAPGRRAQSVFYVYRGALWAFGLTRPGASPCV